MKLSRVLYNLAFIASIILVTASISYTLADLVRKNNEVVNLPISTKVLNPQYNTGLGVYLPDAEGTNFQSLIDFENMVDKKMEYLMLFKSWGDKDNNFPNEAVPYFKSLNITPIITWEPWKADFVNPAKVQPEWSLSSIVSGKHDSYIESWADDIKRANITVIIRFAHEMNGPEGLKSWYPWQGESRNYREAFQRIVNIFRFRNVTNVKFMWSPILSGTTSSFDSYYPGDAYVDYVGLTIINLGTSISGTGAKSEWRNCSLLLDDQYKLVEKWNKPVFIAELLSTESGGSKPEWYRDCMGRILKYPNILGVVSIQINANFGPNPADDWRVNSTVSSLNAFKQAVKLGYK
jgi:mannan endo-1,4-beta-mannosidase